MPGEGVGDSLGEVVVDDRKASDEHGTAKDLGANVALWNPRRLRRHLDLLGTNLVFPRGENAALEVIPRPPRSAEEQTDQQNDNDQSAGRSEQPGEQFPQVCGGGRSRLLLLRCGHGNRKGTEEVVGKAFPIIARLPPTTSSVPLVNRLTKSPIPIPVRRPFDREPGCGRGRSAAARPGWCIPARR